MAAERSSMPKRSLEGALRTPAALLLLLLLPLLAGSASEKAVTLARMERHSSGAMASSAGQKILGAADGESPGGPGGCSTAPASGVGHLMRCAARRAAPISCTPTAIAPTEASWLSACSPASSWGQNICRAARHTHLGQRASVLSALRAHSSPLGTPI